MAAVNAEEAGLEMTRRLVDAAGDILMREGLAGLSLRRLAGVAGTSTMSVYTRFGSKQELLAAMRREGFRRLGVALTDALAERDPLARLARVGQAYRRSALASPTLYGLMFGPTPPDLSLSEADDAAAAATYETLVSGVRDTVAAGFLAGDPERIAVHLWAVAHGMVSLELAGTLGATGGQAALLYGEALTFAAMPFYRGEGR